MRWVDNCGTLVPSVTTVAGWVAPIVFGTPTYEKISAKTWYDRGWCDSALGTPTQSPSISNAADRGTAIHKMIEEAINGVKLHQYPKQVDKAMGIVEELRFRRYELRPEVKLSCLGGYVAGTADLVAVNRAKKQIKIIDWKTGGWYQTYPIQLKLLETAFAPLVMEGWKVISQDVFLGKEPENASDDVPDATLKLCMEIAKLAPKKLETAYSLTWQEMAEFYKWVWGD